MKTSLKENNDEQSFGNPQPWQTDHILLQGYDNFQSALILPMSSHLMTIT